MRILGVFFAICLGLLFLTSGLLRVEESASVQIIIAIGFSGVGGLLFYKLLGLMSSFYSNISYSSDAELKNEPANLYHNIFNSIGGTMDISTDRLIFKSHPFNLKNESFHIPFVTIKTVEPFFLMGRLKGIKISVENKQIKLITKSDCVFRIIKKIKSNSGLLPSE